MQAVHSNPHKAAMPVKKLLNKKLGSRVYLHGYREGKTLVCY